MEKNEGVPVELPAPPGWKKRLTPRKSSRRPDIVFVSPDGEEIKTRRLLDKYLKSHPGGPPASEFDWGTGGTPRRSSRLLGEKSKATESPEIDTPRKRQRKSSSKKGAEEDGGEQEAEGATEKETKGSDEPALPDAEITPKKVLTDGDSIKDDEEKTNDGEIVPEEPPATEDKVEILQEKEEKTNDGEIVPEEPPASEDNMEIVQEKEETADEVNIEKMEIQEDEDKPLDNIKDDEEKTNDGEIVPEEPPASEDTMEIPQEKEEKTNDGEIVPEEPPVSEDKMEIVQEKEETTDEVNIEKVEIQEDEDKPLDNSLNTDNKPLSLNVLEETKIESTPAGTDASSHSAELSKATSASQVESAEEAPAATDALNVLEENKIENKPDGIDASSHSAELSKATSASQEEIAEKAPAAADALNVIEENKAESKPAGTDASSHSAELSKAASVIQEETAEGAAADPLVQKSNDAKVDENKQIDREIPIEEINGTEPAATGVNDFVQNNSVQQEGTIVDQVTSS